jgi:hypothetical protein
MAVSQYEQQALDWAAKWGVTMTATFSQHGHHWPGDADTRDIYDIDLRRGGAKMTLRFAQSLARSAPPMVATGAGVGGTISPYWQRERTKAERSGDHYGRWAKHHKRTPPTLYDILTCVQKSDPCTFDDFCSDCGYDTDSIKAKATFEAVDREWHDFNRLCGGDGAMMAEAQEIS